MAAWSVLSRMFQAAALKKIEVLSSLIRGLKVLTIGLSTQGFNEFPDLP
jgi:hypothetical protein